MAFEWDPSKARRNRLKHGVSFADGVDALGDERALTVEDLAPHDERRFATIGMDSAGRLLVVVTTFRGENVRVISARRATKRERRSYEVKK